MINITCCDNKFEYLCASVGTFDDPWKQSNGVLCDKGGNKFDICTLVTIPCKIYVTVLLYETALVARRSLKMHPVTLDERHGVIVPKFIYFA